MMALLERLTGLAWLAPSFFLAALLVPAALWWRRRRGDAAIRFGPGLLVAAGTTADGPAIPGTWRTALRWLPRALEAAGLLAVVVALARPVHRELVPLESEGIDILLCLDTSSSMTATDLDRARTRLLVARDAAVEFIAGRPFDRIGLLTFARYADVRCPLTLDHAALSRILTDLRTVTSDGPEDATGIGAAVARAAQVLAKGTSKSKVVILLTDGEENVALPGAKGEIAPAHAAQLAESLGVRVYAIVAGGGATASTTPTRLDTGPIERLVKRTGGALLEARDAGAVRAVYAKVNALERSAFVEARYATTDAFLPFLLAALSLLLLARLLEATVLAVLP